MCTIISKQLYVQIHFLWEDVCYYGNCCVIVCLKSTLSILLNVTKHTSIMTVSLPRCVLVLMTKPHHICCVFPTNRIELLLNFPPRDVLHIFHLDKNQVTLIMQMTWIVLENHPQLDVEKSFSFISFILYISVDTFYNIVTKHSI